MAEKVLVIQSFLKIAPPSSTYPKGFSSPMSLGLAVEQERGL